MDSCFIASHENNTAVVMTGDGRSPGYPSDDFFHWFATPPPPPLSLAKFLIISYMSDHVNQWSVEWNSPKDKPFKWLNKDQRGFEARGGMLYKCFTRPLVDCACFSFS
jgi:hypothetical protein